MSKKLTNVIAKNCGVNLKTCTPTREVKVLSPPFGRNLAVGFKNETKTTANNYMVAIINKKRHFIPDKWFVV